MTLSNLNQSRQTNDAATVPSTISVTNTGTVLSTANADRIFWYVTTNKAIWLRFYDAGTDNIKRGIFVPAGESWFMEPQSIYTGEISAVRDGGNSDAHVTEY